MFQRSSYYNKHCHGPPKKRPFSKSLKGNRNHQSYYDMLDVLSMACLRAYLCVFKPVSYKRVKFIDDGKVNKRTPFSPDKMVIHVVMTTQAWHHILQRIYFILLLLGLWNTRENLIVIACNTQYLGGLHSSYCEYFATSWQLCQWIILLLKPGLTKYRTSCHVFFISSNNRNIECLLCLQKVITSVT